jgi:heparosan-N-sulfate-glucuronate 5-epimerase
MAQAIQFLQHAARAMRDEILGFRFEYPLESVPQAGPKDSLEYYLYSDRLSWEVMRLDSAAIPRVWGRVTGAVYRPAFIAWWGLVNLGHYLRRRDQASLDVFLNQVDWLERNAVERADGAVIWPMHFDCQEGNTLLKAPWLSCNAQGLVISALVRGYRVSRRPDLLRILRGTAKIFQLDAQHGGVRVMVDEHVFYTEIPGGPCPGILDGFMTSLLGLYDLFVETNDLVAERSFRDGIEGLKYLLPKWDHHKKWSWYGAHAYLSPPSYHCVNRVLLTALGRLTNEPLLLEYASTWDPNRLSTVERTQIFLRFVYTKNACRLRNKTWRQRCAIAEGSKTSRHLLTPSNRNAA